MMRSIVIGAAVVAALSLLPVREAAAQNGQWSWTSCGATQGWSDWDRELALVNQGIADPCVNYWTPFYARIDGANYWAGTSNTGYQNTFAVNHDINANFGIPYLGYVDIFTPLLGTNELAIASTVANVATYAWNGVVSVAQTIGGWFTSLFSSNKDQYQNSQTSDTGGYPDDGFDDGFSSYDPGSYGGYSGDCGSDGYCD